MYKPKTKTKTTIIIALGLFSFPALADSGKMVKSIGSGNPLGSNCIWFQTSNAQNGIDPLKYAFSKRDTAYDQYLITINNAFGSPTPPKFTIGDPQDPENFHPEDCPLSAGFTYIHTIVRGP